MRYRIIRPAALLGAALLLTGGGCTGYPGAGQPGAGPPGAGQPGAGPPGAAAVAPLDGEDGPRPGAALRADMHGLWHYLIELDHALAPPPQRQDVLYVLERLDTISRDMDLGQAAARHPFFPRQLAQFQATLRAASDAARATPPDYDPALKLVDACGRCHTVRRAQ